MSAKEIAPFGAWPSSLSAREVAAGKLRLQQPQFDGADLYWLERRPNERGRTVIARELDGRRVDVTPPGYDVRSQVHEYGGGAYRVFQGSVVFSNGEDGGLYLQPAGGNPAPLIVESGLFFADFQVCPDAAWIVCVREDRREPDREARNAIVAVDLSSGVQRVLVQGGDFYAAPRFSADGRQLAWITWNHPDMPWDSTEVWCADVAGEMEISHPRRPFEGNESVIQPEWAPDGSLYVLSDRTGWWNLYRCAPDGISAVAPIEAEIGGPLWNLGASWYGFNGAGNPVCIVNYGTRADICVVSTDLSPPVPLGLPFTSISGITVGAQRAAVIAGSPDMPGSIVEIDLSTETWRVIAPSFAVQLEFATISQPEVVTFPGSDGLDTHAYYYAPQSDGCRGPDEERPPLIVMCHGGPTSQTSTAFNPEVQFWTTRGFGVVDVDYGGSTGYGRDYRERLSGRMGEVDVDDCVAAALYLAHRGDVDVRKLLIRGSSAGGYVVLAALTFRDAFSAGASYYGIGDLIRLREITHKFESRYEDKLVGPYPKCEGLYRERSPLFSPEGLRTPVILFQGLDDKVVPPHQAEDMVRSLRERGVPFAYLTFPGEGHGFRRAETVEQCLQAELSFYGQVLGFRPAGPPAAVEIENLQPRRD